MADVDAKNCSPASSWETLHARAQSDVLAAERALEALAEAYSPQALFAAAFVRFVVVPLGQASDASHGTVPAKLERLAFYLWRCRQPGQDPPTPEAVQQAVQAADTLVVSSLLNLASRQDQLGDELDLFMTHVLIDAHVVRGSAYPEQTTEEILGIAGRFDAWFQRTLGTSATDLTNCLWSIGWTQERKINTWVNALRSEAVTRATPGSDRPPPAGKKARRRAARQVRRKLAGAAIAAIARDASAVVPVSRTECTLPDGSLPSEATWKTLLTLIGLTSQLLTDKDDVLFARTRPLFVFDGDRVLVGDISNALDCLWDALDLHTRSDVRFRERFQDAKAAWLEEKTAEYLARIFGQEAVFRNLRYPDPDHPDGGAETELDIAVHWGPFLLLVEAKAKQFRLKGQLGDLSRLRDDLKANIEDAFTQALRARRYLLAAYTATFQEVGGGRTLHVRRSDLDRVYLITVSLHFLGGAAPRLAKLRALGLLTAGEYPWAISISELDLITRFAEGPGVLLHYIERRLDVERTAEFPLNDDLDLFAAYLSTRLHQGDFAALVPKANSIWLTEFQARFDAWMDAKRRGQPLPDIHLELPDVIRDVLRELRRWKADRSALKIAFALLALSRREVEAVAAAFGQVATQKPAPGMFRRFAITLTDLAVSISVAVDVPLAVLERRVAERTLLEKYRRRVTRSMGFGIHLGHPGSPFHACAWSEGPWTPDPELERRLRDEDILVTPGQVLPGRNEPCICGSGRKFKKCCLPNVRER